MAFPHSNISLAMIHLTITRCLAIGNFSTEPYRCGVPPQSFSGRFAQGCPVAAAEQPPRFVRANCATARPATGTLHGLVFIRVGLGLGLLLLLLNNGPVRRIDQNTIDRATPVANECP
jgi:hypothetical protein